MFAPERKIWSRIMGEHSPPIASPYGSGEWPLESATDVATNRVVCLSFQSAFRSACLGLFTDAKQLVVANVGYGCIIYCTALLNIASKPSILPFSLLELLGLCSVGYAFFVVAVSTFWQLGFSRRFEVEIERNGLHVNYIDSDLNYLDREFLLSWNKISWIIQFDGNVQINSGIHRSCFIPRECFSSLAESQAFAHTLRQLRASSRRVPKSSTT